MFLIELADFLGISEKNFFELGALFRALKGGYVFHQKELTKDSFTIWLKKNTKIVSYSFYKK
jgi:hypothetical protein